MGFAFLLILFPGGSGNTEIRISNQSKVAMEEVRVQFPSQTENYGTIPARGVTDYRVVRKAYRYARIEAVVGGKLAVIQPIDYVGEKKLKAGRYTYVLTINENASSEYDRLRLECRKEEVAPQDEIKISVANGTKAEQQTKDQLQRILRSYNLSKWIFTKSILIDEKTTIPHSHPVLTLSVRHLKDDELTTDHYTWIYKTVLERPRDIGNIMFKHQLVPKVAK